MSIESVKLSNHFILCHPLLFLPSIFPSIRVFAMNRLFTSGGKSIGASAPASVLPINIEGWFPLGLTGSISLLSKDSQKSSTTHFESIDFLALRLLYGPCQMPLSSFFECQVLSQLFHSLLSPYQEALEFLFAFYHKSGFICISEVIDISLANLNSSLCFIQSGILHGAPTLHMLNKQGDNIQPWCTPFPVWNQSVLLCLVLTVAS